MGRSREELVQDAFDMYDTDDYLSDLFFDLEKDNIKIVNSKTIYIWEDVLRIWRKRSKFPIKKISKSIEEHIKKIGQAISSKYQKLLETKGEDDDQTKLYQKQINKLSSINTAIQDNTKCKKVYSMAESLLTDEEFEDKLNQQQMLLPIRYNSVVDLRTGMTRARKREDMFTFEIPVEWNCHTKEDMDWVNNLILGLSNEDVDVFNFMKVWLGYGITASVKEQKFLIIYGENGSSGKSSLQSLIQSCLGKFFAPVQKDVFLQGARSASQGQTTFLMALKGKRQAWYSEIDEDTKLNESMIKQITGGDCVSGREMYGTADKFNPTFKLTFITNHKPNITTDPALKRRLMFLENKIRFVPYKPNEKQYKQGEREMNKDIKDFCDNPTKGIKSAFLQFLVEGCMLWNSEGLVKYIPKEIEESTDKYSQEQDLLLKFVTEECELIQDEFDPRTWTMSSTLHDAFTKFCKGENKIAIGNNVMSRKLQAIKYQSLGVKFHRTNCSFFNLRTVL